MSDERQINMVDTIPQNVEEGVVYSINQSNPNSYTHGMFKYPCKFIPEIPRWAIEKYSAAGGAVFDPFSGSGTTALEALISGRDAYCTEIDDIAKLITKVKTTKLSDDEYEQLDKYYDEIVRKSFESNAKGKRPQINNLEHWFSKEAIDELSLIKQAIDKIENENIRDFFYVCFVSIIKKVSYADDNSPKPFVSNKVVKVPPPVRKEFSAVYKRYKKMEYDLKEIEINNECVMMDGDALDFSTDIRVDLAVTSPPYINAFDYGRTMRLENIWMEALSESELRDKKKIYVGTEKITPENEKKDFSIFERSLRLREYFKKIGETDEKRALIVKKFFEDMEKNLAKVNSVLNSDGRYVIVIGNSVIRNTTVESWRVLEELASNIGYLTDVFFGYEIKNPYIRIPRQGLGGKISRDYVLVLKKR